MSFSIIHAIVTCVYVYNKLVNSFNIFIIISYCKNSATLFYTGFPSYEALISFLKYIRPKLEKMQYWKGERLVKGSQRYKEDENRKKPGPSRNF